MQIIEATGLHRKSGGAQWRDLCVDALSWECFSTEESWAFGPPKVMKNGSCSATTVDGGTTLSWVSSTGAQRSGEICGSAVPSWECFSTERSGISYFARLATTTCAALLKESRMQIIKATALHRKSGGAQWRDDKGRGVAQVGVVSGMGRNNT
jgi:hypothetical protein